MSIEEQQATLWQAAAGPDTRRSLLVEWLHRRGADGGTPPP
ncbi:MAG TPA: hypothetical protein VI248_22640 [Kineosporiaceae bacterium]